jgi:phosphoribosyl 1,2-cyclic phosphodiesterase
MNDHQAMQVTFWGVRGSHPVPGSETVSFGGNTSCVEIQAGGHTLILDAGTGIIGLGKALAGRARQAGARVEATILFTHMHHDHIQGFPFFVPAYLPTSRLHLFGPETFEQSLAAVLERNQTPPVFPVALDDMPAAKTIQGITPHHVIVIGSDGVSLREANTLAAAALSSDSVVVRVHHTYAHPGGAFHYRVEYGGAAVVYATDTEGYIGTDQRLAAFARGADLLIHDAQYTEDHYRGQRIGSPATQGFGHSTARMACEVALAAEVKQLVLFHHDPGYDDDTIRANEQQAQALLPNTQAAREHVSFTFSRAPVVEAVEVAVELS